MRIETRGPQDGICNICGEFSPLTNDHIPPKGVPLVGQAYLKRLSDTLGAERVRRAGRHFQKGVKYRSICATCNNELLGGQYDPTLIKFCNELHSVLGRQAHVPIELSVCVNRLLRALVGHILSHGVGQHRIGQLSSTLTDYLLDNTRAFPEDLRAYCWIYPYKAQVVAHGLGSIFDFRATGEPFVFSLLKFYPIGFIVSTTDLPHREAQAVSRLDPLANGRIDNIETVSLNVSFVPPGRWPEAPGKNGVVFHNSLGTFATPGRAEPGVKRDR